MKSMPHQPWTSNTSHIISLIIFSVRWWRQQWQQRQGDRVHYFSGQLRHKLILLFGRSAPIIIQRVAITATTPVSWFPHFYINKRLQGAAATSLLPLSLLLSATFPNHPFHFLFFFPTISLYSPTLLFLTITSFFPRVPRVAYNWICRGCMSKYN